MNTKQTAELLEEFIESTNYPQTWYPELIDQFKMRDLFEVLRELTDFLGHERAEFRSIAVQLTLDLMHAAIARYILPILTDNDANVRSVVCQALPNYWNPEAEDALTERLRLDPNVNVRRSAITSLIALKSRRSLDALLNAVAEDFDTDFEGVSISEQARFAIREITS